MHNLDTSGTKLCQRYQMRLVIENVKLLRVDFSDHGDLITTHIVAALWTVELLDVVNDDEAAMKSQNNPDVLRCNLNLLRVCL